MPQSHTNTGNLGHKRMADRSEHRKGEVYGNPVFDAGDNATDCVHSMITILRSSVEDRRLSTKRMRPTPG
jgi:hypothetical protein